MQVLIQNCLTDEFLSPTMTWVAKPGDAQNFRKLLRAWDEIAEGNLSDVRIVLRLGDNVPEVLPASIPLVFHKGYRRLGPQEISNRSRNRLL